MSKAIKPKAPRQPKTLKKSTGMYMPKIKPIKLVMGYMKKKWKFRFSLPEGRNQVLNFVDFSRRDRIFILDKKLAV